TLRSVLARRSPGHRERFSRLFPVPGTFCAQQLLFTFRNDYGIVIVTTIGTRETCLFPEACQRGSASGCKRSGQ
ncbi:MAG TPA: hypothetical protein VGF67_17100, partial [Ktedonobacteraceae bacterium]